MADESRQRVERVRGSRRARLTPAPGTDPAPEVPVIRDDAPPLTGDGASGPNDERLRRDVPPHY
ncbi:hypothetical protein E5344_11055 [Microbacterium laevaniformans]|uniref:Uncharacterized protein n=1 Tax=Microbacterium laevaniformans TaxID=36807 RepID=A0A4S2D3V8_9MICO|nr:hypothetical protein [Microbacterium laevaniformans]TGY35541.1 hypothetical protein E5344_11055 [Microbacterium laevaniformans]